MRHSSSWATWRSRMDGLERRWRCTARSCRTGPMTRSVWFILIPASIWHGSPPRSSCAAPPAARSSCLLRSWRVSAIGSLGLPARSPGERGRTRRFWKNRFAPTILLLRRSPTAAGRPSRVPSHAPGSWPSRSTSGRYSGEFRSSGSCRVGPAIPTVFPAACLPTLRCPWTACSGITRSCWETRSSWAMAHGCLRTI